MHELYYPILLCFVFATWGFLHTWLASLSTKRMVQEIFGETISRFYRLIFIGISSVTFSPILLMLIFLPSKLMWVIPMPWVVLTVLLQTFSLAGIIITLLQTDVIDFLGLRRLINPNVEMKNRLVVRGFYRFVRHPIYFFCILFLWLIPYMTNLLLAFVLAASLYFWLGTYPEELKLVEEYGKEYQKYQKEVPRIIPGLKID